MVDMRILANNEATTRIKSLIDTGAQYCFFDNQFAKALNIDYKDTPYKTPISGIGGKQPENYAYFHDVKLQIYKPRKFLTSEKPWEVETKIGFLEKNAMYSAILGEYGFFDNFAFNCVLPDYYFELKHMHEVEDPT